MIVAVFYQPLPSIIDMSLTQLLLQASVLLLLDSRLYLEQEWLLESMDVYFKEGVKVRFPQ
jgi:hypothetical protein